MYIDRLKDSLGAAILSFVDRLSFFGDRYQKWTVSIWDLVSLLGAIGWPLFQQVILSLCKSSDLENVKVKIYAPMTSLANGPCHLSLASSLLGTVARQTTPTPPSTQPVTAYGGVYVMGAHVAGLVIILLYCTLRQHSCIARCCIELQCSAVVVCVWYVGMFYRGGLGSTSFSCTIED